MYYDYLLRFDTEAEGMAVLYTDDEPNYYATDIIGTIYEPTGVIIDTPDGPVDEMAPLPGWHVNVRHNEEVAELDIYRVYPESPVRVWL